MNELAKAISEYASKAVATCELRGGGKLDFTAASLQVVEEVLAEAAQYKSLLTPSHINGIAQEFGCYILDVAHREFGGHYLWHNERDQPVLVVGEPGFRIAMLTWDKVRGRAGGDTAENIPFFYLGFSDRVRNAQPGDNALYV